MGSSPDTRIVKLKPGMTAAQAFNDVTSEAAWESGHGGYSGTLAEKDGMVIVAQVKVDVTLEQLNAAVDLIESIEMIGYEGYTFEGLFSVPTTTDCGWPCQNGKVKVKTPVTLPDGSKAEMLVPVEHDTCHGTGKRPLATEEIARAKATADRHIAAFALFFGKSRPALERAGAIYSEKWGPAAAIVAPNLAWFGGYCSS